MSNITSGTTPPDAATCTHGAELKAYLDGELIGIRRWVTRRHVARCSECRAETARIGSIGAAVHDLDKATPRRELRARIMASLPETPPAPATRTSVRPAPRATLRFALAGALALAVVASFALLRRSNRPLSHTTPAATNHGSPNGAAQESSVASTAPKTTARPSETGVEAPIVRAPNDPDGVNRAADELFRTRQEEENRRLQRELADQKRRAPEGLNTSSSDFNGEPMRLLLVASNPQQAHAAVLALMHDAGGRLIIPQAAATTTGHWPSVPTTVGPPNAGAPPAEIVCMLPVSTARALVDSLKKLGSVTRLINAGGRQTIGALPSSRQPTDISTATANPETTGPQHGAGGGASAPATKTSGHSHRHDAEDVNRPNGEERYVTIAVTIVPPQS